MGTIAEFASSTKDSQSELVPLFKHAPLGLAMCRPQGNISALNPALEQELGGQFKTGTHLYFADLIHPQQRTEVERLLRELFDHQRDSFQIESQIIPGTGRSARWTAWLVPSADGGADCALALAEFTPIQESGTRPRQVEKLEAVGRLAGGVAHDFNNLLTGVLLYCDLLMANLEPGDRKRKYAEEIRNAGLQASGLVRQLLGVARPTSSEPRLHSLNQVAESMRGLLVPLIGENIELQFHLDPNLGLIKMDPSQSQQILLNLVLNARDAMPGGGQISVETCNCKVQVLAETGFEGSAPALLPCALFVVSDNGCGMDAATRTHVFEAFFTTKGGNGTGLGLATVYEIVTSHGGLIHVDSAPGRGARFSILLPLVPDPVSEAANLTILPTRTHANLHSKEKKEEE